jgi:hypothetical protein
MDHSRVSRNGPCPCGSGKKYKHCCLRKEVEARSPRPSPRITDLHGKPKKHPEYPIGTVALYGPNDKITTKIAAGVIKSPSAEPILERWVPKDWHDVREQGTAPAIPGETHSGSAHRRRRGLPEVVRATEAR